MRGEEEWLRTCIARYLLPMGGFISKVPTTMPFTCPRPRPAVLPGRKQLAPRPEPCAESIRTAGNLADHVGG